MKEVSSLYIFSGKEIEALTTYEEEDEVAIEWKSYMKRHGGGLYEVKNCLYCTSLVDHFWARNSYGKTKNEYGHKSYDNISLLICPSCGWYRWQTDMYLNMPFFPIVYASSAMLEKKLITDEDVPISELRRHLISNWGDRKQLTAGQAEELVADIFKEHLNGEVHYITNGVYSPDGGIDFAIVNSDEGLRYAFQVKRRLTDKPECIENVRAFLGAISTSKFNHGYYVTTTPRFTRVATQTIESNSENLKSHNLDIKLVDGTDLFRILKTGHQKNHSNDVVINQFKDDKIKWQKISYVDFKWGETPEILSTGKLEDLIAR